MDKLLHLERSNEEYRSADGSCVVVSGWHRKYGHVACKVFACFSDISELLKSREVQILNRVSHSNICPVHLIFQKEYQGLHYLVIMMPFVPTTLAKESHKRAKLGAYWKEAELWSMLGQVVSALSYAQGLEICHRDIKCSNILLDPAGRVLVADFGSGKMGIPANSSGHSWVGSIDFLSPELQRALTDIILGTATVAEYCPYHSDVYSLGVTFLSLMRLGLPKYQSKPGSPDRTNELGVLLEKLRTIYSEELLIVIGSMLEYDATLRPSFVELEETLQVLKGPAKLLPSSFLTCKSCHDPTKTLIKLACHHYYCKNCLLAYANSES